ncbi:squalene synthase HpnC [Bordetella sp. FB-8]|uniref:squalene synthase HpnC n=1 Tax=Bordetella sp. FB-8 TaxID=1159870 RepID=UPI0003645077|nr:squalene synthase HpnC [Bordetella sp. FB-8]
MAVNHYENFPVASLLLPRRLRPAVHAIYRYARSADDIADEGDFPDRERLDGLARYRLALQRIGTGQTPDAELAPVFAPLAETIAQHQLPLVPFFDLLSAFEQDVTVKRYDSYAALLDYCARSANPVGRLMLALYDAATPDNLRDADAICTGLQLVNFWQDVRQDQRRGRIYLPLEDLRHYGVNEENLTAGRITPQWRALMAFETQRAAALLNSGASLAGRLPVRIALELRLVVEGGLRILQRIEQADYDVFMNRPELRARDWAAMFGRAIFKT